jgi:tripeptidyl-peptidase-1
MVSYFSIVAKMFSPCALLIFLTLSLVTLASPTTYNIHIVHEKRYDSHGPWIETPRSILHGAAVLHMRIALAQSNLHFGEQHLLDISDPSSPHFGQHWSPKKVAQTFGPSATAASAVYGWLLSTGIRSEHISHFRIGWLEVNVTVNEAEQLLRTEYHIFERTDTGTVHIACNEYSVPRDIQQHIDFITPTIGFTATAKKIRRSVSVLTSPVSRTRLNSVDINPDDDLSTCAASITPNCLRALYGIPRGTTSHPNNSYGIVEFGSNSYIQQDLDVFFSNFSKLLVGRPPIFRSIDGGIVGNVIDPDYDQNNIESDLDLEYAMSLVYPLNVTLFQTGDPAINGDDNNFLDAIDPYYCTYEGGDDPAIDPIYPDKFGYNHSADCGIYNPTNVISISFSGDEDYYPQSYAQRQCHEYMKLGLQGVTVLFPAGDYGVGSMNGCLDPATDGTTFRPSFPGSCPYVTAVGGTQINPNSTVFEPESAVYSAYYSGGGFSNYFAMPWYQEKAVLEWFDHHPTGYPLDVFNSSKKARGYPDVAANGNKFLCQIGGYAQLVDGTSASVSGANQ